MVLREAGGKSGLAWVDVEDSGQVGQEAAEMGADGFVALAAPILEACYLLYVRSGDG